jgi:hypothetical protein
MKVSKLRGAKEPSRTVCRLTGPILRLTRRVARPNGVWRGLEKQPSNNRMQLTTARQRQVSLGAFAADPECSADQK